MNQQIPASLAGAVDLSQLAASHAGNGDAVQPNGEKQPGAVSSVVVNVSDSDLPQLVELSRQVPVIIDIWAEWCEPCKQLTPVLEKLVAEQAGALVLAKLDADKNPQAVQAFKAQSIPTVAAIIGGTPVPLFTGALPEDEVREVLSQVLAFAKQQGITGAVPVNATEDAQEPVEEPLPPLHQQALEEIERRNWAGAISAYETQIAQNPRDSDAVAGLAQVRLLERLDGPSVDQIRQAAAADPRDLTAQLLVADLDLSGGHVEDAFARVLDLVAGTSGEEKQDARLRLIDYFEIVGHDDSRVAAARRRLTTLLY